MGVDGVPLEDLGALRHEVAGGAEELPAVVPVKVPVQLLVPIQVGGHRAAVLTRLLCFALIGRGFSPRRLKDQLSPVICEVTTQKVGDISLDIKMHPPAQGDRSGWLKPP